MMCLCLRIVTNSHPIALRLSGRGGEGWCSFYMLCYKAGTCYIFGLKTECNCLLLMNSSLHNLSKWIGYSLHLTKRKTDVIVQRLLSNLFCTDLTSLPGICLIFPENKEKSSNATFLGKLPQSSHQCQVFLFYTLKKCIVK